MSVASGPELPPIYTVREVAARWQVSEYVMRACLNSGELAGFRIGRRLMRVRADMLDEFERRVIAKRLTPEEREARDDRETRRDFQWRLIKSAMLRRPKHVNAREVRAAEAERLRIQGWDEVICRITRL